MLDTKAPPRGSQPSQHRRQYNRTDDPTHHDDEEERRLEPGGSCALVAGGQYSEPIPRRMPGPLAPRSKDDVSAGSQAHPKLHAC